MRVNALNGKRRPHNPILQVDGITFSDPVDTSNTLGEYFAGLSSISEYEPDFIRRQGAGITSVSNFVVPMSRPNNPLNRNFTIEELSVALRSAKGESTGPDGIGYKMLKQLSQLGQSTLLSIFNDLWNTHEFPEGWRHSLVIPIPKIGQSSNNCSSKILERMANRRLVTFLTENRKLDYRQFAFRPDVARDVTETTLTPQMLSTTAVAGT
ncbi:uncharacterized protein LOC129762269 [Toxorhynchites rutilus septentrionalis]|uniref:uncharacterized protein LOC129762269 n=1 Tax=Toxorhynchites rutilus septentrionalis TaxID=329112 RepID=UPI002478ACBB|nr:uncharacterized protein LOC129762269 [Toxorhynchites rutilus septentrionalis]